MAKRDEQQRKLDLLDQLARQRAQITSQKSRLATQIEGKKEEIKEKINVPKRLKNNICYQRPTKESGWPDLGIFNFEFERNFKPKY